MAWLERLVGDRIERYELRDVQNIVGRAQPAQILIRAPEVSRKHAEIIRVEGGYYLRDKGSQNGTLHNGSKIRHVYLRDGDVIRIGKVDLVFRDPSGPTSM